MQRRHFELIARTLRDCELEASQRKAVALCFCVEFSARFPMFKPSKFLEVVMDECEHHRAMLRKNGWTKLG